MTVKGLVAVAPLAGLLIVMGAPAAAVSGGLVVDVVEDATGALDEVDEVGDWALTPWVVVVELDELWEEAGEEPPLQAARPTAAAATMAGTERSFMGPSSPAGPGPPGTGQTPIPMVETPEGIPDLVAPRLRILFCGINPGWRSAERGLHFGGPGNRFWKVLQGAGLTDRLLDPSEQSVLPSLGLGITNLVDRPTRSAAELTREELRAGAASLETKVSTLAPHWVAVVGMDAYRRAFARPRAGMGRQSELLGPAGLWVLPNPSGLQARYGVTEMITAYAELARAAGVRSGNRAVG